MKREMTRFACRTNVEDWASPFCKRLDGCLQAEGFQLLDLPWKTFELRKHDRDHFTMKGFDRFRAALTRALVRRGVCGRVLVIADSTIDWLNDERRSADAKLVRSLARRGIQARVVSQSGSGFCALRGVGRDFSTITQRYLRTNAGWRDATWVVVGGWNDEWEDVPMSEVRKSIRNLVSLS